MKVDRPHRLSSDKPNISTAICHDIDGNNENSNFKSAKGIQYIKRYIRLLRPLRRLAFAVAGALFLFAVAFLFIRGYFYYTLIELKPVFSDTKFIQFKAGVLSFELPDIFSLESRTATSIGVTSPGYRLYLTETIYPDSDVTAYVRHNQSRCYGHEFDNYNQEEDDMISSLSQYRTIVFTPKEFLPGRINYYFAVFFLDLGCV
ncbi:MAG: hypothetical protein LBR80_06155 [Deltaproteobacteria bacterium]|jgi:hypothetical protein|nr:hypothetical protein [Deltaproteobacteria bacterium]